MHEKKDTKGKICPTCGKENDQSIESCIDCGAWLGVEGARTQAVEAGAQVSPAARETTAASLQELVERAEPDGIVVLEALEYALQAPLRIAKPLHLMGAGSQQTRVYCSAPGAVLLLEGDCQWTLKGIAFEHRGEQTADVVVVDGAAVEITGCTFRGAVRGQGDQDQQGGVGLRLKGATNALVRDCQTSHNGWRGMLAEGDASVFLQGNHCSQNGSIGIAIAGRAAGVVRDSRCIANSTAGIVIFDQAHPFLDANQCSENKAGIVFRNQSGGTAYRNLCHNNTSHGIQVSDHAQPFLEANQCQSNHKSGISFYGETAGTALGNICVDNGRQGIWVGLQAKPLLYANQALDNRGSGLVFAGHSTAIVRANVCAGNHEYGIVLYDKAAPQLEENKLEKNRRGNLRL